MNISIPWNTTPVATCVADFGCGAPGQPVIDLADVNPACSTGNCSTACTNVTTLFGSASEESNMYQCMRYQDISVKISNGTFNSSEISYYSSLGIYGSQEDPDVLTTAAKLISDCFVEYCEVSVNGCIRGAYPIDIDTSYGAPNSPDAFGSACTTQWLLNGTTGLLAADMAAQCFVEICTPATATNPDSK